MLMLEKENRNNHLYIGETGNSDSQKLSVLVANQLSILGAAVLDFDCLTYIHFFVDVVFVALGRTPACSLPYAEIYRSDQFNQHGASLATHHCGLLLYREIYKDDRGRTVY